MRTIVMLSAGMLVFCAASRAQDIEAQLSGNTAAQGFTVKSGPSTTVFTVRGDGHAAIGTATPTANLHVSGIDGFLVTGVYGSGAIPGSGPGPIMMFYPKVAAFRAGYVSGGFWDASNIGTYSFACGYNTKANGYASVAMGLQTTASGSRSFAMGDGTSAAGSCSFAMGDNTSAASSCSFAIGRYNIGGGDPYSWVDTDPLFEIGIGSSSSLRADAMTVLKNGNVGIGENHPGYRLHVRNGIATVSGPSTIVKDFYLKDDGTGKIWAVSHRSEAEGNFFNISYYGTSWNQYFAIRTDGKTGIGTMSPSYLLHVNGEAGKPGGGSWTNASDARLKDVLGDYTRGLKDIVRLHSVRFRYKPGNPRNLPSDAEQIGFIAQEVREVFPETVTENSDGYLDFNMHAINVALVNAVRELSERLTATTAALDTKSREVATLSSEVDALRAELRELRASIFPQKGTALTAASK